MGYGGTFPGGSATISSTSSSTKGIFYWGDARTSGFDETDQQVGLNVAAPAAKLDMLVGAPVGQTARPSLATALHPGIGWDAIGAATLVDCVDDTDADLGGTDYARYLPGNGFNDTLTVTLSAITNPGVTSDFSVKLTMRSDINYPSVMRVDLSNVSGVSVFSGDEYGGAGYVGAPVSQGNVTTGFVQYIRPLTAGEVALIDFNSTLRVTVYNSGLPGSGFWDVAQVEIVTPAVGGTSVESLHKWSTGTYTDLLAFTGDGGGGTTLDLTLSGDSPLRVSSGGGTSGLRFLTSSTNGRIEVGTSAQANMNLVFSGARATAGTLLTSDFTAHLMNGALDVFLSTDRTGLRVRQFTTSSFDLIQFSANNGTSHFYRMGSDGQSYFGSSTTAGVVNIGGGTGPSLEIGTDGTTGYLTIRPSQSSAFDFDFTNTTGIGIARFRGGANQAFDFRGRITSLLGASDTLSNITHTITKLASQTGALFEIQNDSAAAFITVNASGQMQFTTTAGAAPVRIAGGSPTAVKYLGSVDTTGDASWRQIAASEISGLAAGTTHALLSAQHTDTTVSTVLRGSLIVANSTPLWDDLVIVVPAAGQLNVLGVINGELDPSWKGLFATPTVDVDIAAETGGSATTAMRSDAKLQLSQAIAPTWTGAHTWTGSASTLAIQINQATSQTENLLRVSSVAAVTDSFLRVSSTGEVIFGHNGGTQDDAIRKLVVRGNSTQSSSIDLLAIQSETTTISAFDSVGRFKLFNSTGGNSTTFDRNSGGANHVLIWPNAIGSASRYLTSDGSSPSNLSWAQISLTAGVTGVLPIANGGSNKALTLANGGILWTDADSFEVSAAGTLGQLLRSAGAAAPTWTTATFPATAGSSGNVLTSDGTNWASSAPAGGGAPHAILDGSVHTDSIAQTVSVGSLIYGNATPKWDELAHPGVANRALRSTSTLPTWAQGDIDFGTYKAIAMACDNGTAFPTSPTPTEGQWFLFEPGSRRVLYQRVNGAWEPIFGFGSSTITVATTGNDTTGTGEAGAPYLTVQKAVDQVPGFNSGSVVINIGAGSFAGFTVDNKRFTGAYSITIQGVSAIVSSRNITTTGAVLGSQAVQPIIKLTTAGPAQAVVGGIVVFTSGGNDLAVRVINTVSTTTNANDTLTLCGDALAALAAANADTLSFRPLTTIIAGDVSVGSNQSKCTLQYLNVAPAPYGIRCDGTGSTISECHVTSATGWACVLTGGEHVIGNCAFVLTVAGTAIYSQRLGVVLSYGTLCKGVAGSVGLRLLYGYTAFLHGGTVVDTFTNGISGAPGVVTFYFANSNVFVKNCSGVGINAENQLVVSKMLDYVVFSGNTTDYLPYMFELGVAVTRRAIVDINGSVAVSDHIVAYTTLTGSRTLDLLPVVKYGVGKQIVVKNETANGTAGSVRIRITANGAELIDGAAIKDVFSPYGAVMLYTTATGFYTMADR